MVVIKQTLSLFKIDSQNCVNAKHALMNLPTTIRLTNWTSVDLRKIQTQNFVSSVGYYKSVTDC